MKRPIKYGLIAVSIDLGLMLLAGLFMLIGNLAEMLTMFIIGVNLYLIPNYPFTTLVTMIWVGEGALFWTAMSFVNLIGYFFVGYLIGLLVSKYRK